MKPNHQQVRELFYEALDLPPDVDVNAWVAERCGDDISLRDQIASLLESNASETKFMPEKGALQDTQARILVKDAVSLANDFRLRTNGGSSASQPIWIPPGPAEIDSLLDAYEVTEMVGHGGMGTVYRGFQISLERMVAIKVLPPEFGDDATFAARFRREALSMAKLDHPNIVTIHDFGSVRRSDSQTLYFIVMEFVAGADLQRLISCGEMSEKAALGVVGQICDALQYAHDKGFVHRDIKPANIFVSAEGAVKVGDFGLAKLCDTGDNEEEVTQMTHAGIYMGTPHYMAPESLKQHGVVDHRSDIYSLGVMFYQMLTGSLPKGIFKPPSKKVNVDSRLDEIVIRAMNEEPEERYQSVSQIRRDVAQITRVKMDAAPLRESRKLGTEDLKSTVSPKKILFWLLLIFGLLAIGYLVAKALP